MLSPVYFTSISGQNQEAPRSSGTAAQRAETIDAARRNMTQFLQIIRSLTGIRALMSCKLMHFACSVIICLINVCNCAALPCFLIHYHSIVMHTHIITVHMRVTAYRLRALRWRVFGSFKTYS